jgi:hypothetical protein
MQLDSFNDNLTRSAKILSVDANLLLVGGIVAAILILFSFGVVVQVMMISREKKLSLRSACSQVAASVWAIPVLAVLACFALRAAAAPAVNSPTDKGRDHPAEATEVALKFEPVKEPPLWTSDMPVRRESDNFLLTTVVSARGASVADAERQLAAETAGVLRKEYPKDAGLTGSSRLTPQSLQPLVARKFVQPGYETVGVHRNKIARVYWQLDLSGKNRDAVRSELATPRLWIVVGAIGLLAIVFIGIATYLRLDAATAGRYRLRLKLATTTLICASGLLLTALLPVA